MAPTPRKSTAKSAAKVEAAPLNEYADKELTDTQERAVTWILEQTGYKPADLDTFKHGLRLSVTLYHRFQASPENKAANEARATARVESLEARAAAKEERDKARAEREEAKATRAAEREAKKAAADKEPAKKAPAKKVAPVKPVADKTAVKPRPRKRTAGSASPF